MVRAMRHNRNPHRRIPSRLTKAQVQIIRLLRRIPHRRKTIRRRATLLQASRHRCRAVPALDSAIIKREIGLLSMRITRSKQRLALLVFGLSSAVATISTVRSRSPRRETAAAVVSSIAAPNDRATIYQQQEGVGWVFGRVIGFQGADKPLLPRQAFPKKFSP